MLTLTAEAETAIRSLVEADPANAAGIRIATTPAADGEGRQLGMEIAQGPQAGDEVIDADGARVFLDMTAASLLDQETLDVQLDADAKQVNFFLT
ncbi:MAG TPA: hypothetical protein VFH54_06365 [Mycobacteriales bacterium]|nr:hypothetical protein [Mycobacteriales bacterium]